MFIRQLRSLFLFCLISCSLSAADAQPDITEAHFFDADILPAIQEKLSLAQNSIICAAYELNNREIIDTLKERKSHGISVEVVLARQHPDKAHHTNQLIDELSTVDIPVWQTWDYAHDKILIIDNKTVITGSFNYTNAALNQRNNSIVITANNQAAHDQVIAPYINHIIRQQHRSNAENNASQTYRLPALPEYCIESTDAQLCRCGPVFAEPLYPPQQIAPNSITNLLCAALSQAKHSISCAYFDFDNEEIAQELCEISKKKIAVDIIACYWQINQKIEKEYRERLRALMQLAAEKTRPGSKISLIGHRPAHQIMHNKYMIIDDKILLTGSANATKQANKQWENVYVTIKPTSIAAFKEYFARLVQEALPITLSTFTPATPVAMLHQSPDRPRHWAPQRFVRTGPMQPPSLRAQRMLLSAFADTQANTTPLKRANTTDSDISDRETKRANSPGVLD